MPARDRFDPAQSQTAVSRIMLHTNTHVDDVLRPYVQLVVTGLGVEESVSTNYLQDAQYIP